MNILALDFPPVSHLFDWPDFAFHGNTYLAMNKTVLIYLFALGLTLALFMSAGAKKSLIPRGVSHIAEGGINFVEDSIVMQTMGEEGKKYVPFLTTIFFFIFFSNIF